MGTLSQEVKKKLTEQKNVEYVSRNWKIGNKKYVMLSNSEVKELFDDAFKTGKLPPGYERTMMAIVIAILVVGIWKPFTRMLYNNGFGTYSFHFNRGGPEEVLNSRKLTDDELSEISEKYPTKNELDQARLQIIDFIKANFFNSESSKHVDLSKLVDFDDITEPKSLPVRLFSFLPIEIPITLNRKGDYGHCFLGRIVDLFLQSGIKNKGTYIPLKGYIESPEFLIFGEKDILEYLSLRKYFTTYTFTGLLHYAEGIKFWYKYQKEGSNQVTEGCLVVKINPENNKIERIYENEDISQQALMHFSYPVWLERHCDDETFSIFEPLTGVNGYLGNFYMMNQFRRRHEIKMNNWAWHQHLIAKEIEGRTLDDFEAVKRSISERLWKFVYHYPQFFFMNLIYGTSYDIKWCDNLVRKLRKIKSEKEQ